MRREPKGRRKEESQGGENTIDGDMGGFCGPTHGHESRRAVFERADLGGRQCLIDGEQDEDRRQSFWRASFVRAGRAGEQNVVTAGLGTFKGAPGGSRAAHIF
jgi:hypothetical protein